MLLFLLLSAVVASMDSQALPLLLLLVLIILFFVFVLGVVRNVVEAKQTSIQDHS